MISMELIELMLNAMLFALAALFISICLVGVILLWVFSIRLIIHLFQRNKNE